MKAAIQVDSREAGKEINQALNSISNGPQRLKALTRIIGILEPFPQKDKDWVCDRLVELVKAEQ